MLDTPSVSLLQSEVPSEGPSEIPAGKRATVQTATASAVRCSLCALTRALPVYMERFPRGKQSTNRFQSGNSLLLFSCFVPVKHHRGVVKPGKQ